jgi:hypothetical protein
MDLVLLRQPSGPDGTPGTIWVRDAQLYSIEQPWNDNAEGHSCVPVGTYQLVPYVSPKHGPTWYLLNHELGVGAADETRSYCELHSANWARQLEGCIALGLGGRPMLDPVTGRVEPAVERSVDAIDLLHAALGEMSTGHTLTIQ